jgi:putative hemolysin
MNKTKAFTMIAAIAALAAFAAAALTTVQPVYAQDDNSSCSRTGEVFCVLSGNTNSLNENRDSFNFEID